MESTLGEILKRLAGPFLPNLLAPEKTDALLETACRLPTIPWAILEFRLAAGQWQVDLSQRITADDDEPAVLLEHIQSVWRTPSLLRLPTWSRLLSFLTTWCESSLHDRLPKLWLEFDGDPSADMPAIFFAPQGNEVSAAESLRATHEALSLLLPPGELESLAADLDRCFGSCQDGAFVNQVGVMLSRPTKALRINVEGLAADQVLPILRHNGYSRVCAEIQSPVDWLVGCGGHLAMIDFDLGPNSQESVGLEVCYESFPDAANRWALFLDQLVHIGLCTADKRDDLAAWRGTLQLQPTGTPNQPWLEQIVKLKLSHIKLAYHPGAPWRQGLSLVWSYVVIPQFTWYSARRISQLACQFNPRKFKSAEVTLGFP